MFNFTHFNQKNTHISTCKNVQITKKKKKNYYNNYSYMHGYCSRANDFFILFFCLPLHHALLLCLLLTTKPQNHPYPTLNHRSLSSSNNKITKPPLLSLNHRSRWYHPNTKKNQKLKLVITHHNTKTQKLKLAITHHRTNKNQMKSNSNINQNQDEVKWGQCSTTSRLEVAVVGRCNWGWLGLLVATWWWRECDDGDGEVGLNLRNLLKKKKE